MDQAASIAKLVEPSLEALGYELVRVRIGGGAGGRTLQIMAERRDRRSMTVDDCAAISRDVSALLDVEDPIAGPFALEVSSPGLDRPLVRREDYTRFAGCEARVETRHAIDGRRRFKGRLAGLDGDVVRIDCAGSEVRIPLDEVVRAKLILTGELVAAAMHK